MDAVLKFATENYQIVIAGVCIAIYAFRVPLLTLAKRFKLTTDATPNPNAPIVPVNIPTNLMELGKWIVDRINEHRQTALDAQKDAIVGALSGSTVAPVVTALKQTDDGNFEIKHGDLTFKVPATALVTAKP